MNWVLHNTHLKHPKYVSKLCPCSDDVTERERTLPYIDEVPGNPTVEDMLKVVVEEEKRPPLLDRWRQNPVSTTFI